MNIAELSAHVGETVELRGWLYNKRGSKKLQFLEVRDGSGMIQCVVSLQDAPQAFESASRLSQESSLVVQGVVSRHPKRNDVFELAVTRIEPLTLAAPYPISPKEHGTDFLMDHRHLWLRSRRQHAILRVRHALIRAIREFFDDRGFTLVDAPIFTPNACEGTSTLFETDFHGQPAFLTQSGQLYMEAAAAAFGKAYCFGPTFRAEKSKTRRHLAEFWMVEPEVAFLDLAGDMQLAEEFLAFVVGQAREQRTPELEFLGRDLGKLESVATPFPKLAYRDAIDLLRGQGKDAKFGDDFGAEDETIIGSAFDRPVIVHRYPAELKAFYMKRDPEDSRLALCMDVLAPEGYGEIIGGGQREDELSVLSETLRAHQLPEAAFGWYLDLRRYGSFPHAGFGLGLERLVAWVCGLSHVRETIPFPRMLTRLTP